MMGEWPTGGTHHLWIRITAIFVAVCGTPKQLQWSLITGTITHTEIVKKVWNTVGLPKHDWDSNWANAVGNMAPTDLLNLSCYKPSICKNKEKNYSIWSTLKLSTGKRGIHGDEDFKMSGQLFGVSKIIWRGKLVRKVFMENQRYL